MSALPNLLPSQKKPPAQATRPAKLNRFGRDPGSPGERTRDSSDFDTEKGYAPFFHAFLADWPRLSSGHVSDVLFMWCLSRSLGRSVKKGEPRPQATLPFIVEEAASALRCDVRSIERELAGWKTRKVAEVTSEGKGLVVVKLLYRTWEVLPDYKNVVEITSGKPAASEVKDTTKIELTKEPVACKAGGRSKAVKVDCGIKKFHLVNPSVVDLEITAMVLSGDLVVTARVPDLWNEGLKEALKRLSVPNVSNDLDSPPRHGCHSVPEIEQPKIGRKSAPEITHPRAAELAKLFDPILGTSHAVPLSQDVNSLQAACEAVGDCDHHFLVKFAVQRSERPVKSPLHVEAICREALASWKASNILKSTGVGEISLDEVRAMAAKERAARLEKKR